MRFAKRYLVNGCRLFIYVYLLFFLIAGLFPGTVLANRSYQINRVDVEAEILPDGSMQVWEHFMVDFRGTYQGMFRWINKSQGMEVVDMRILEGGFPYEFNPGDTYGPAGTYYISDEPDRFFVDWSFNATDQSRNFVLDYRVLNAVTLHEDTAELYYQFFGDESDIDMGTVNVQLTLPEGADKESIRAWGHGPLYGEVTIESPRLVTWEVSPLPKRTFLEGRVLFPPELVPQATSFSGEEALASILEEEEKLARAANLQRAIDRTDIFLGVIIFVGVIIFTVLLVYRFKRKFKPTFSGDYYRELPADYSPAELGVLWNYGAPGSHDITATIMDLARRGFIKIEEYTPEKKGWFSFGRKNKTDYRIYRMEKEEEMRLHEEMLSKFLFSAVARGKEWVSFKDIEEFAQKKRSEFSSFLENWENKLANQGNALDFFDRSARKDRLLQAGLGLLLIGLGYLIYTFFDSLLFTYLALMGAGIILVIPTIFLRRRSLRGTEDFVRWEAFRRFLLHFSEMPRHEIPSLVIWEHYMVYAITLGVASNVIKQLQVVYPNLQEGDYHFGYGWYYGYSVQSTGGLAGAFENMVTTTTNSMRQSAQTASSTSSSGSGSGGGFSGGGSGGGGGGGGGVGAR